MLFRGVVHIIKPHLVFNMFIGKTCALPAFLRNSKTVPLCTIHGSAAEMKTPTTLLEPLLASLTGYFTLNVL